MSWKKKLKLPGLIFGEHCGSPDNRSFFFVLRVFARLSASRRQCYSEVKRKARFGREQTKKKRSSAIRQVIALSVAGNGAGTAADGPLRYERNRNRNRNRRTRLAIAALAASALF